MAPVRHACRSARATAEAANIFPEFIGFLLPLIAGQPDMRFPSAQMEMSSAAGRAMKSG
jgi:hypothetical protein